MTIFGESAGGIAVSRLCASPLAQRPLPGRNLAQSGRVLRPGPRRRRAGRGEALAAAEKAGAGWASKSAPRTWPTSNAGRKAARVPARAQRRMASSPTAGSSPSNKYKLYTSSATTTCPCSRLQAPTRAPRSATSPHANVRHDRSTALQICRPAARRLSVGRGRREKDRARPDTRYDVRLAHVDVGATPGEDGQGGSVPIIRPHPPPDSPRFGFGSPHAAEMAYVFSHLNRQPTPRGRSELSQTR